MTAPTTKLGADMQDAQIEAVANSLRKAWQLGQTYWQQADSESWKQQDKSNETRLKFEALMDETRRLLARQPAAIGKEAVGQWVHCSPSLLSAGVSCANTPRRACECNPENGGHDHFIAHSAAPLDKEASKPAAQSDDLLPNALWTRNGSGSLEWWTFKGYEARKDAADQWVLRRAGAELYRHTHLQVVMAHAERAILAAPPAAPSVAQDSENTDDIAVESFARAMKEKMAQSRAKGRSGWEGCEPAALSRMLREHVEKGDPRDVANFCMMLWHHSAPIAPSARTANVAQGAEEPDCWAILTPNGSRLVSPDEAKGRLDAYPLYRAPPAQPALADDARDAFIRDVAAQKPEKPDHWSSCGQCGHNIERAQDLLDAAQSASASEEK